MKYQFRLLARVVVEATTPLSVGSGKKSVITDSMVAKDVNGLPYIPATAIAGVLHHAIGEDAAKKYFGDPNKDNLTGSKIIFTEAKLVGKDGTMIDGLRNINRQDDFYQHYFNLPIRQHVRLNEKGCVDVNKKGKFDEQIVYKGSRFCFEIEMLSETENNENFKKVLNIICSSEFKVGSGTTCGFGSLEAISCKTKYLDMKKPDDMKSYANKSSDLSKDWKGEEYPYKDVDGDPCKGSDNTSCKGSDEDQKYTVYELLLNPEDFFLFGSGFGDDEADMTPVREEIVTWEDNDAHFSSRMVLIPATSVKGAIAHRVAFHYNKLKGCFAGCIGDKEPKTGNKNLAVRKLFGCTDCKGNVEISDVFIKEDVKEKVSPHVAIDRFTGGTIDGALYAEKTIYGYGKGHTVKLTIKVRKGEYHEKVCDALEGTKLNLTETEQPSGYDEKVCDALEESLKDICRGLLPLGGGVNRGNGTFTGILKRNNKIIYEYK